MRLLIETDILFFIEGDFILTIEELGFRVIVREVGSVSQTMQRPHHSKSHPEAGADSNEEVPGFEDIDKDAKSEADIGSKD